MTSTTDTAGHPDVAEISDLAEGLLPPSRTADVRRHLDDCGLCTDVYDSLEEIRGLLGTLPGPTRMPDDVAGRIDAALAAEALLSAVSPDRTSGAEDDGVSVSRETSTADISFKSDDSDSASAGDRPLGHPRAATGPGRGRRARRGRRRAVVVGTVFTAAALGLGTILVQSMGGEGKGPGTATQQESGSKVTFSEETLKHQVADLLAKDKDTGDRSGTGKPWGIESQDAGGESGGVDTLGTPTVPVPDCVQQGTGDSGAVLAAKEGTFKGTRVYLVVLPDDSDSAKVTAYIVDAACKKQDSPSPGKLLLTRSYAKS
ncbi:MULTISPECIES: anti-sigma factor family protein [Streptomyces]|uniref:Zinc-finger domain-containing protein n=1 Tax=Streptomyces dengpaensis TaxID=2049881 RepID=A0ABM6SSF1_9ACTN|nr:MULTISPECIES: hypothetical protein [Streptomyces]AVH57683.1 hypothetical protein C4B68_20070 [Streptomyces dengpaensis]PIB07812.1 hypothetical protein B1C81_17715 [Streptomyces sp. HG99]